MKDNQSVRVFGVSLKLRARFIETNDAGLREYPHTAFESKYLDRAVRSALHIYGDAREDSMPANNYARAVLYVAEETAALRWISRNPLLADAFARKCINAALKRTAKKLVGLASGHETERKEVK